MLSINNITQKIENKTILSNISLTVQPGEIIAIVGPNGSGKSTLLKIIMGLSQIEQGHIVYFNQFNTLTNVVKKRIGFLYQVPALDLKMTVKDMLYITGLLYSINTEVLRQNIQDHLSEFDLMHLKGKKCGRLSGGERRLIDLIRLLVTDPDLMILDEPFNELDTFYREKLFSVLMKYKKKPGKSVLLTTHLINECDQVDNLTFLKSGEIFYSSTPSSLLSSHSKYILEVKAHKDVLQKLSRRYGGYLLHNKKALFWMDNPDVSIEDLSPSINNGIDDMSIRKTRLSDIYIWLTRGESNDSDADYH